jgi:hypothetical protein
VSSPVAERLLSFQARLEDAELIEKGRKKAAAEDLRIKQEIPESRMPWLTGAVEVEQANAAGETADASVDVGVLPELDWLPIAEPTALPEAVVASRGLYGRLASMVRRDELEDPIRFPLYM